MPEPAPIFRRMLRKAWSVTWQRKSLWVFGMFAFFISSGGVMDVALRTFKRIDESKTLLDNLIAGSFAGAEWFALYLEQLARLGDTRIAVTLAVITLLALAGAFAAVLSQGALIAGITSSKELSMRGAAKRGLAHFWDIAILDVFAKGATLILLVLTTVPLFVFLARTTLANTVLFFALFLIFFPAVVVVNMIATLALIDIVKRGRHVTDAIAAAARMFVKHWLAALEMGFLLFFLTLFAGIVTAAALALALIPYTLLIVAAQLTATPFIFVLVQVGGFGLLAALILSFAGAVVAFQHAAWVSFYDRALGIRTKIPLIAALNRWFS